MHNNITVIDQAVGRLQVQMEELTARMDAMEPDDCEKERDALINKCYDDGFKDGSRGLQKRYEDGYLDALYWIKGKTIQEIANHLKTLESSND